MSNELQSEREWGLDLASESDPVPAATPDRLPTVANWVEEFKATRCQTLSVSSQDITAKVLERFALWIGTRRLSKELIVKYCDELQSGKLKGSTLSRRFSPLNQFLRWCHQMDHIQTEMAFLIPRIRLVQPTPQRFSPEQYAALKNITKGTIWHYASILAYRTGMRLSDVCLLEWKSVNLEEMYISYIPFKTRRRQIRALCPIESGGDLHEVILDMSKTRSPHPMWSKYVCPEMAMYYAKDGGGGFTVSASGTGLTFKGYCCKIGARHLSFHKLRNSFMSRVVDADLNWMKVCQITGLRTFSVMMRYAKPDPDVLRKDMEKLSRIESEHALSGDIRLIAEPVKPQQLE